MDKVKIRKDKNGNKIVILPDIIFKNKQGINWKDVENSLFRYIGEIIEITESRDMIHIGNELPDEYSNSRYTRTLKGARAKAKANAVQGIREMVEIASNKTFSENRKEKHFGNAGRGWYYYTTRFALPIYDNKIRTDYYNVYKACLIVNHATNGKMYLYDLVDIKKEASNPLKTTE